MLDVFVYNPQHVWNFHNGIVSMIDEMQIHIRSRFVHSTVVRFVNFVLVDVHYGSSNVTQNSVDKLKYTFYDRFFVYAYS